MTYFVTNFYWVGEEGEIFLRQNGRGSRLRKVEDCFQSEKYILRWGNREYDITVERGRGAISHRSYRCIKNFLWMADVNQLAKEIRELKWLNLRESYAIKTVLSPPLKSLCENMTPKVFRLWNMFHTLKFAFKIGIEAQNCTCCKILLLNWTWTGKHSSL